MWFRRKRKQNLNELYGSYSPPKHKITTQKLTDYFNTIQQDNFIIGGDYNAKHQFWGCRANNPRGLILYNFVINNNFKVLAPPGPTYWPTSLRKNPDILDIFVTKIPNRIHTTTENLLDLNSDRSLEEKLFQISSSYDLLLLREMVMSELLLYDNK